MGLRRRVRILTFVQYVVRFIKVWWAWERHEWDQMAKLLEGMVGSGLDANGERILLGVALTRQGRLSDGLHHFARVTRHELLASEEPVFFNEYAFALYRAGQVTDAADLLRSAPLDRFPAMQRRWANEFIESHGHIKPPPLEGLKTPRVLH